MQKNRGVFYLAVTLVLVCTAVGIATTALSTAPVQPAAPHTWKNYTNVRFQYVICYPEDLLAPQGEADNSDGEKFLANDGGKLIAFGSNNALNEPLKNIFTETSSRLAGPSGKVTYKVLKPRWFVVSGQNGPTVFYAKTLYSHGKFKSFELTYDGSAAAVYEPVILRIAECFADLTG